MSTIPGPRARARLATGGGSQLSLTSAAKAYVGGGIATAIAFLGALGTALSDNVITGVEWTVIGVATFTALGAVFGGVWATTNSMPAVAVTTEVSDAAVRAWRAPRALSDKEPSDG